MKLTGIKEVAQRWNESYKAGRFEPYSNWRLDIWVNPKTGKVTCEEIYGHNCWTTGHDEQIAVDWRRDEETVSGAPDLRKTSSWLRECVESELERQKALESHWAE